MIDAPMTAKRFTPIFSLVADTCFGSEMIIVSIDETSPSSGSYQAVGRNFASRTGNADNVFRDIARYINLGDAGGAHIRASFLKEPADYPDVVIAASSRDFISNDETAPYRTNEMDTAISLARDDIHARRMKALAASDNELFSLRQGERSLKITADPETGHFHAWLTHGEERVQLAASGAGWRRLATRLGEEIRHFGGGTSETPMKYEFGPLMDNPDFNKALRGLVGRAAQIEESAAAVENAVYGREQLERWIQNAVRKDQEDILAMRHDDERISHIVDLMGNKRDGFTIRARIASGDVSGRSDYLEVRRENTPDKEQGISLMMTEVWEKGGEITRSRHTTFRSGPLTSEHATRNMNNSGRLHSFNGEPSSINEKSSRGGWEIVKSWHDRGQAVQHLRQTGSDLGGEGMTYREEWTDGQERLHREDGPALVIREQRNIPEERHLDRDESQYWLHGTKAQEDDIKAIGRTAGRSTPGRAIVR